MLLQWAEHERTELERQCGDLGERLAATQQRAQASEERAAAAARDLYRALDVKSGQIVDLQTTADAHAAHAAALLDELRDRDARAAAALQRGLDAADAQLHEARDARVATLQAALNYATTAETAAARLRRQQQQQDQQQRRRPTAQELAHQQQRADALECIVAKRESELATARSALADRAAELGGARREAGALRAQLAAAEERLAAARDELRAESRTLELFKSEHVDMQSRLDEWEMRQAREAAASAPPTVKAHAAVAHVRDAVIWSLGSLLALFVVMGLAALLSE